MRWFDYAAIGCALVMGLVADYTAGRSLRASLLVYIPADRWIRTFEIQHVFGSGVYPRLRQLVAEGLLERKTDEESPHLRSGHPDHLYRRKAVS